MILFLIDESSLLIFFKIVFTFKFHQNIFKSKNNINVWIFLRFCTGPTSVYEWCKKVKGMYLETVDWWTQTYCSWERTRPRRCCFHSCSPSWGRGGWRQEWAGCCVEGWESRAASWARLDYWGCEGRASWGWGSQGWDWQQLRAHWRSGWPGDRVEEALVPDHPPPYFPSSSSRRRTVAEASASQTVGPCGWRGVLHPARRGRERVESGARGTTSAASCVTLPTAPLGAAAAVASGSRQVLLPLPTNHSLTKLSHMHQANWLFHYWYLLFMWHW